MRKLFGNGSGAGYLPVHHQQTGGTAGGGTGGGTTNNGGSSTAGNNATGGGGTGTGGSTDSAGGNTGSSGNTTIPVATITEAKVAEFQTAITNATAGSTVNLAAGTVPANSKISIGKALTVDGKGIEGLTVELASAVSSSVVLKNFKKATIKIAAPAVSSSIMVNLSR